MNFWEFLDKHSEGLGLILLIALALGYQLIAGLV